MRRIWMTFGGLVVDLGLLCWGGWRGSVDCFPFLVGLIIFVDYFLEVSGNVIIPFLR